MSVIVSSQALTTMIPAVVASAACTAETNLQGNKHYPSMWSQSSRGITGTGRTDFYRHLKQNWERLQTIAFRKTAKRHLFSQEFGCVAPFTDGIHVGITPMFTRHFKKFWEGVEKAWKHRGSTKQKMKHYSRSTCVSSHLKSADLLDSRDCACQREGGSAVSRTETRGQLNSSFSVIEF